MDAPYSYQHFNGIPPIFQEGVFCGAAVIELDPDRGCLTYTQANRFLDEDGWGEEDEFDEAREAMVFEEDDELWLDDDDDDY